MTAPAMRVLDSPCMAEGSAAGMRNRLHLSEGMVWSQE